VIATRSSLFLAALCCVVQNASAADVSPVAIYPLQALGTDPEIAERLDATLRAEAARIPGVSLIAKADVLAAAARVGTDPGECARTARCLASIGAAAEARTLAYGTVASLGQSYVLDIKLIDARSRKELRRRGRPLSGAQAVLIEGVRDVAYTLLAPEQYVGTLEVRADAEGALLAVDGDNKGALPLAPVTGLAPGPHKVVVTRPGFEEISLGVPIRLTRTTVVNITTKGGVMQATVVERDDAADDAAVAAPPRSLFPATVALGGLGAGLMLFGAAALTTWGVAYAQVDATLDEDGLVEDPAAYAEVEQQRSLIQGLGVAGAVALPVGAVALGAGVVLLLLDPARERHVEEAP
jgi:hypothetical protein